MRKNNDFDLPGGAIFIRGKIFIDDDEVIKGALRAVNLAHMIPYCESKKSASGFIFKMPYGMWGVCYYATLVGDSGYSLVVFDNEREAKEFFNTDIKRLLNAKGEPVTVVNVGN